MNSLAWKLLPYLRPYKWRIAWALIQIFLISGFELLKPWPLQLVINDVLGGKSATMPGLSGMPPGALLVVACCGLVIVNIGAGLLALLHNVTTISVGQSIWID